MVFIDLKKLIIGPEKSNLVGVKKKGRYKLYIKIIEDMYTWTLTNSRSHCGITSVFPITKGLLQRSELSPYIF